MALGSANPLLLAASGGDSDPVTRSLRYNRANNSALYIDPTVDHDSTTVFTFSCWAKLGEIGATSYNVFSAGHYTSSSNQSHIHIGFLSDYRLRVSLRSTADGVNQSYYSTALFRDPAAWYAVTLVRNGTSLKAYVNNVEVISQTIATTAYGVGNGWPMHVGANLKHTSSSIISHYCFDGLIADAYFTDGYAKAPTDFIESNGYGGYKPKAYTGSFGTNGFHLKLDDSSDLGADDAGSNDFTATGLSSHDVMLDNPFKNHPTWNPLVKSSNTFAEGNLKVTTTSSTPAKMVSTIGASSGKWYAELLYTGQANYPLGVTADNQERNYLGSSDGSTSISFWTGTTGTSVYINGSSVFFSGSSTTWANGDIIGIALNADDEEVSLYKNGSLVGAAVSYSSYNWTEAFFAAGNYVSGLVYHANFGQDPTFAGGYTGTPASSEWAYSPPTGFKSLNSSNLDAPTVTPSEHFNTVLYNGSYDDNNGTGTATQSITGVGFSPDIVWIKDRDNQAYNANSYYGHFWFDDVLSAGNPVNIDAEQGISGSLNSGYSGVSNFDSDGFSIDEAEETNFAYDSSYSYGDPDTFERYVAWCWKLGTTASSWSGSGQNPDSEQYNSDAGVSIIDYYDGDYAGTSITLNHSLGTAPEFAITLDYEGMQGGNYAWHKDLSSGNYLELSGNGSQTSDSTYFPSSPATNTTFEVGSSLADGMQSHVALFRSVEGFSKFGSYKGVGSNGVFVYTGHRPKMIWIKNKTGTGNWFIFDAVRDTYNEAVNYLRPNSSGTETTNSGYKLDILSNGFRINVESSHMNNSSYEYIFCSFAEQPFAAPSNAR